MPEREAVRRSAVGASPSAGPASHAPGSVGVVTRCLLGWLAMAALVAGLVAAFGYAPREHVQGNVQRIMYLHVPAVLTSYLAFGVTLVSSLAYLGTRRLGWDRLAASAAELGVLFTGITIASGSIWGKPTWGTWWTWDARLTTTAVLFLVYVGYLLLRGMVEEPERRARYAAVVGILAAANIPVVHFSVKWWRALHQPSTILGPQPAPIAAPIALALYVNLVAFTLLFGYLLVSRVEVARLEDEALSHAR
jgi:heme exporter protein C